MSMSTIADERKREVAAAQSDAPLPERLRHSWIPLALLDIGVAAVVFFFSIVLVHEVRAATIAVTVVLTVAWTSGRYRRSLAVTPRDEIYSTSAIALEAAAFLVIAVPLLSVSAPAAAAALLVWTALAAAGTVRLCESRRAAFPRRHAEVDRLDHLGRVRARSPLLHVQLRCADLVLATIGTILLSPVLAAVAIAIVLDSGRPVIFRQARAGAHDREFTMLKFRTMKNDAGSQWVQPGDDRITRVGRFLRRTSLDELPQLWNVLAGEMSLVGPRPEMLEYADRFSVEATNYPDRHILPPGITGWAQLYCPRNLEPGDMPHVLRSDLFYIQNADLHLYLFCIVKTAFEIFWHKAV